MVNSSEVSHFTLGAYFDTGPLRWLYFVLTLSVYVLILLSNLLLIVVICWNRTLHEPMYIFLCSLFMNEIYGSTALFPLSNIFTFLLHQTLKDVHTVSVAHCFLQLFCLYTYANVELFNLAVMSYDRYVAICHPLQYRAIITMNKAALMVGLIWVYSFTRCLITISISLQLTLCSNFIDNLFCHNYLIVRLACSDTQVNNIYGYVGTTLSLILPLLPIFFSYTCILRVALGRPQRGQKAIHTCIPHIVSLLNFALGSFLEIVQTRFQISSVPMRILLPLYLTMLQPVLNPLMYGLKTSAIRRASKHELKKMVVHGVDSKQV
uniref:Olfactory receptor n=1 Tax=Neogobius melanostomus TaxID=47308 RepID=A0A8C6SQD2_9GOBI